MICSVIRFRCDCKSSDSGKELIASQSGLPVGYVELLENLKTRVRAAQVKAVVAVNRELIQLYWDIGRLIVERQEREGWGKAVIARLADDVQRAFPGLGGFSRTNVFRMRAFFLAYAPPAAIVPQLVGQSSGKKGAQPVQQSAPPKIPQAVGLFEGPSLPQPFADIPWGHNALLIEKVKDLDARRWYAFKTIEHGWSRAVLTVQIETNLFARQGKAITNFAVTLPSPQSDLAQQTLKDPYVFDFLTISDQKQLEFAIQERRALFTFNAKDFARLHREFLTNGRSHSGIIVIPEQRYSVGQKIRRLAAFVHGRTAESMTDQMEFL